MKKRVLVVVFILAFFISGCSDKKAENMQTPPGTNAEFSKYDISEVDSYMASVKEESDSIKCFLENDAMTQTDMNQKSNELYELWKEALNHLILELEYNFTEDEFAAFIDDQALWIAETETAIEEAGKGYETGSIYPLIVNSEGARLAEERVYKLYDMLKETVTENWNFVLTEA